MQGVTHVSTMAHYPGDFATGAAGQWVAHFGHPVELEWSCKQVPAPGKWPIMYFQVGGQHLRH
jgi:hypothetical protein